MTDFGIPYLWQKSKTICVQFFTSLYRSLGERLKPKLKNYHQDDRFWHTISLAKLKDDFVCYSIEHSDSTRAIALLTGMRGASP
jgi:hypothetical protein